MTVDEEGFFVGLSNFAILAKINYRWELVWFFLIQNWECMQWNQDVLASLAVEAYLVEIIAEGCDSCGSELNRQNLADT